MGKVETIAKWDLINNKWKNNPSDKDKGRSFSFINYEKIFMGYFRLLLRIALLMLKYFRKHFSKFRNDKQ